MADLEQEFLKRRTTGRGLAAPLPFGAEPRTAPPVGLAPPMSAEEQKFLKSRTLAPGVGAPTPFTPEAAALYEQQQAQSLAPAPVAQPPQQPAERQAPAAVTQILIPASGGGFSPAAARQAVKAQKAEEKQREEYFSSLEQQAREQQEANDRAALDYASIRDKQQKLADVEQMISYRQQETQARKVEAVKAQLQKIDQAEADFTRMKVSDFWADKSTGTKIVAALSMAFGAAGASLTGGPNTALQIINGAIERDLERQKANIQLGQVRLEHLRGALPRVAGLYEDELAQIEASRLAAYQYVQREIDALMSGAKSKEMVQNGRIVRAQFDTAIEEQRWKLAQIFAAQAQQALVQSYQKGRPARVLELQDAIGISEGEMLDWQDIVAGKVPGVKSDQYVKEYGGVAPTVEEAKAYRKNAADRKVVKTLLDKLIRFRENNGQWNALSPAKKAEATAIHTELMMIRKGKSDLELGVLAGADLGLMLDSMSKPNDVVGYPATKYKAVRAIVQQKEDAERANVIPVGGVMGAYKKQARGTSGDVSSRAVDLPVE